MANKNDDREWTVIGVHAKFMGTPGEQVDITWHKHADKFDVIRTVAMLLDMDIEIQPLQGIKVLINKLPETLEELENS